ncbi:MAG: 2-hydroxyacyl-CoA dehydratase [Candidatus Marinimicrobia bacterium]|nr:2-hydroxyacyl-CoA dehydratase [FCB group bacterium]MBL7024654.1 2-hydroxyacyl-CoA dehydratase [Candidatus Neomarinimicrobiota bacterium]
MMIPTRSEYLKGLAQKGQRIMAVLPALYPRELLWAFHIHAAEIWDPPGEILHANAHLQTTICPIVKKSLEFILKEPHVINAGYLFPHTCDSLQNLGTQVKDLIGVSLPVYTFYNPKGSFNNTTTKYYQDILKNFQSTLEASYGRLDPEKLLAACVLSHKIDTHLLSIQQARMTDRLALNNQEYFKLMRAQEYLLPIDYLTLLELVDILEQPADSSKARMMVSGILPPNPEILGFLDEVGVSIVADDLLAVSRRLPTFAMDPPGSPLEYLTDRFFILPPCSTRAGDLDERLHYLNSRMNESQAQGILFDMVKFCEPELFDHRFLVKTLRERNIPVLTLETELENHISGQDKTRIEAFTEILFEMVAS